MSRVKEYGPLFACLILLAILDLLRLEYRTAVIPSQIAVAIATVALLAAWLARRQRDRATILTVCLLALLLLPTYLYHGRHLESDGIHYYSYARSLLFDRDLDLANDYRLLLPQYKTHAPNVLPIGAPLLWLPFLVIVRIYSYSARFFGASAPTGVEPLYQGTASLASMIWGFAGLFLLRAWLARWVKPWAALLTTLICWWATPMRFYLKTLPSLAHACEFFAAVLVVIAWRRMRASVSTLSAMPAGLACGLVFCIRSQDGLLLALPAVEILRIAWDRERRKQAWRMGLALLAGFVLAALPQILTWQIMFGQPFLIPHKVLHGGTFMHTQEPQLWNGLISPRGGVLTTYPALALALCGLLALRFWRQTASEPQADAPDGLYVAATLVTCSAMWYLNASIFDWYHVRRYTGLVPLLAPGVMVVTAWLMRARIVPIALLTFLLLRYDLAIDTLRPLPGVPATVRATLIETADQLVLDAYLWSEPVAPRLATRWLAAYDGDGVLDADVTRLNLGDQKVQLRFPEAARHLSDVTVEDGRACRWVTDREARIFFASRLEGEMILTIEARALETDEAQFIEVLWNEASVGRLPMQAAWGEYRVHVPPALHHFGTNSLVLRFDRAPIFHRVRGSGPRGVRPAAVANIEIHCAQDQPVN
jgi:hypothetical protein